MKSKKPTPFQTASRLLIMVGTLACGSLAAWNYGPEPDRLAEMIDSAASMVIEVPSTDRADEGLSEAPPAPFDPSQAASLAPLAPATEEIPRWDPAIQQASALQPVTRAAVPRTAAPAPVDTLERERLTAPALAAGATRADVQPWGNGTEPLFRATAAAPTGAPGLEQRLDAYGATPEAAVASLVEDIRNAMIR